MGEGKIFFFFFKLSNGSGRDYDVKKSSLFAINISFDFEFIDRQDTLASWWRGMDKRTVAEEENATDVSNPGVSEFLKPVRKSTATSHRMASPPTLCYT